MRRCTSWILSALIAIEAAVSAPGLNAQDPPRVEPRASSQPAARPGTTGPVQSPAAIAFRTSPGDSFDGPAPIVSSGSFTSPPVLPPPVVFPRVSVNPLESAYKLFNSNGVALDGTVIRVYESGKGPTGFGAFSNFYETGED